MSRSRWVHGLVKNGAAWMLFWMFGWLGFLLLVGALGACLPAR